MLAHDFISTKVENISYALQYYPEKRLLTKEMRVVAIKDKWIRKYFAFFRNLLFYNNSLEEPVNCLMYYGKTIIPFESSRELLKRIKRESIITRIRLRNLVDILEYSSVNCFYIVHIGI